jgi:hypothetical protein
MSPWGHRGWSVEAGEGNRATYSMDRGFDKITGGSGFGVTTTSINSGLCCKADLWIRRAHIDVGEESPSRHGCCGPDR